jgi:hypothetical protein
LLFILLLANLIKQITPNVFRITNKSSYTKREYRGDLWINVFWQN